MLMCTAMVMTGEASAEASTSPSANRALTEPTAAPSRELSFGTTTAFSVLPSAPDNRLVVTRSGGMDIYTLDSLLPISSHEFSGGRNVVVLYESSAFALLSDQNQVVEIQLSSGSELNRWEVDDRNQVHLAISPTYVWFTDYGQRPLDEKLLCRLSKVSGANECFADLPGDRSRHLRDIAFVDPSENSIVLDMYGGGGGPTSGDWFARVHLVNGHVVLDPSVPLSAEGYELAPAPEADYTLWRQSVYGPVNVATSTLHPSPVLYGRYGSGRLAVEPVDRQLIAVWGNSDRVEIYRRGTPVPVTTIYPENGVAASAGAAALTTTEVFRLERVGIESWLRVYQIPADDISPPAPGKTHDGLAGFRGLKDIDISVISSLELVEGQNRVVIAGGDTLAIYELDTLQPVKLINAIDARAEVSIEGPSVFLLDRLMGHILEYRLQDGELLNRWPLPVRGAVAVTASPDHIWFSIPDRLSTPSLGRLDRTTGDVVLLPMSVDWDHLQQLDVNPANPNELLGENKRQVLRMSIDPVVSADPEPYSGWAKGLGWGSNGEMSYSADRDRVVAVSSSGERYEITPPHARQPIEHVATQPSGSNIAVATYNGAIAIYQAGSSEPTSVIETWTQPVRVAISETEVAVVSGRAWSFVLTIVPQTWDQPDNTLEITVQVHGETVLDSMVVEVSCAEESALTIGFGTTVRLEADPQLRMCYVDFPHLRNPTVSIWYEGRWAAVEGRELLIDMSRHPRLLYESRFRSPVDSVHHFVEQSYLDVTGVAGTYEQISNSSRQIGVGELTELEFIGRLTQEEADYEEIQAPISRLYRAYFLRNPDRQGHQFWVKERRAGRGPFAISEFFASSPEFETRYGSLDDTEFVWLVYRNVMNRSPDEAGQAFWLDQLAKGLGRGELMALFSDSPEFRIRTDADVFVTYISGVLERRELTSQEHRAYVALLASGGRDAVVSAILDGAAYHDRFWAKPIVQRRS